MGVCDERSLLVLFFYDRTLLVGTSTMWQSRGNEQAKKTAELFHLTAAMNLTAYVPANQAISTDLSNSR
jgi:hypothetical protein